MRTRNSNQTLGDDGAFGNSWSICEADSGDEDNKKGTAENNKTFDLFGSYTAGSPLPYTIRTGGDQIGHSAPAGEIWRGCGSPQEGWNSCIVPFGAHTTVVSIVDTGTNQEDQPSTVTNEADITASPANQLVILNLELAGFTLPEAGQSHCYSGLILHRRSHHLT